MATLTLSSMIKGISVEVAVDVEGLVINTSNPDKLSWFIAHNWVHNGGFGVAGTPQAWVPVYGEEAKAYFWLHVDNMADPRDAKLLPHDGVAETPTGINVVHCTAAEYLRVYITTAEQRHATELKQMDADERLMWLSEFLVSPEPWGRLFANVSPSPDEDLPYVEVALIDGSTLFITSGGATLIRPIHETKGYSAWIFLTRETNLQNVPDDVCFRT